MSAPTPLEQLTREQLRRMSDEGRHAEIDAARRAGRLDDLLAPGGAPSTSSTSSTPSAAPEQLTREQLRTLVDEGRHAEIDAARRAGRLVDVMSGVTP